MKTVRRPPYPKWNPGYFPCSSLTPLPLSSRRPSVSFGGFGVKRRVLAWALFWCQARIEPQSPVYPGRKIIVLNQTLGPDVDETFHRLACKVHGPGIGE